MQYLIVRFMQFYCETSKEILFVFSATIVLEYAQVNWIALGVKLQDIKYMKKEAAHASNFKKENFLLNQMPTIILHKNSRNLEFISTIQRNAIVLCSSHIFSSI